jgi:hypothetical protein
MYNYSFLFFLDINITRYLASNLLSLINSFLIFLLIYTFSLLSSFLDILYID